jgi:hypothetical protein
MRRLGRGLPMRRHRSTVAGSPATWTRGGSRNPYRKPYVPCPMRLRRPQEAVFVLGETPGTDCGASGCGTKSHLGRFSARIEPSRCRCTLIRTLNGRKRGLDSWARQPVGPCNWRAGRSELLLVRQPDPHLRTGGTGAHRPDRTSLLHRQGACRCERARGRVDPRLETLVGLRS